MRSSAKYFLGKHDFKSFMTGEKDVTVRNVFSLDITENGDFINIFISADGFLYNMVRIIAGTLIRVGGGEMAPDEIPQILGKKDRTAAGPTAPAHGLTMMGIEYEDAEGISET